MRTAETLRCASCGGPAAPDLVKVAPEFEKWLGLVPVRCADCREREEADEAERERAEQERRVRHVRAARLRDCGVPPNLLGYSFADIDRPEGLGRALDLARRWAAGELAGLGLLGPVGVGKSRVSVAAACEACRRTRVRWYSAPVLVARLGSGEFKTRERQEALDAMLGSCPLVLDDLDKARPTEYAAEVLFTAVDARADGGGQLMVTTNLNGGELARRWPQPYGEALASRLQLLSWLRVAGEDKRTNGGGR